MGLVPDISYFSKLLVLQNVCILHVKFWDEHSFFFLILFLSFFVDDLQSDSLIENFREKFGHADLWSKLCCGILKVVFLLKYMRIDVSVG